MVTVRDTLRLSSLGMLVTWAEGNRRWVTFVLATRFRHLEPRPFSAVFLCEYGDDPACQEGPHLKRAETCTVVVSASSSPQTAVPKRSAVEVVLFK